MDWVDEEGFPTKKFVMEKMPTIIHWTECLKVVARDAKFLGTERVQFVADWWVNCALRKLAGRAHWSDSKIFSTPISQAMLPKNNFMDEDFPAVASNLEAAGILFMENAAANIRDEHSEVWGSGGNWLGMEAPDPRGSVCERAQPQ